MSSSIASHAGPARSGLSLSRIVVISTAVYTVVASISGMSNVVAACYFTWAILCLARLVSGDTTSIFDSLWFFAVLIPRNLSLIGTYLAKFSTYAHSALPVISPASLVAALWISGLCYKSQSKEFEDKDLGKHCKPLIFPCRTTHTRMFPKRHSFEYSYLLAGVPVGPKQHHGRYGSMLSVDNQSKHWLTSRKGWFHVQGSDYLERGNEHLDLKGKLTQYLRSQGVSDNEWHHAYLVTAPKFLGYSFNPVSFWYIYSEKHQLVMMILEVNNTFDERRMYLLKATGDDESGYSDTKDTSEEPNRVPKFTNAWSKDFHVSPFNSRMGSYSLGAVDPFHQNQKQYPYIDNNIVLRSSDDHTKLVARIFSEGLPRDPSALSTFEILNFLVSWWWVGLVTFPRILKEAYKLYFQHQLQVFFRPEIVPTSIGRNSTQIERKLESFFHRYLQFVVSQTNEAVRISYTPAAGLGETRELLSPNAQDDKAPDSLEIKVTSPAFYGRFMHYSHTSEALDREGLFTDEKNRTVWISNPQALRMLPLQNKGELKSQSAPNYLADSIGWRLLRRLRCPAPAPSYPENESVHDPAFVRKDIRPKNFSACDEYVMQHCPDGRIYRRSLLKLFLAQRLVLGFTEVIDLLDLILRVSLVVGPLLMVPDNFQSLPSTDAIGILVTGSDIFKVLVFNGAHIWSSIKGAL